MNHYRDIVLTKLKLTILLFFVALISINECQSQNIGINNDGTAPNKSALLDLKSDNKGFLVPRIFLNSDTDASTIANPAHSLFIYNTNDALPFGKTFYYNELDSVNPHWVPFFQKYDAWHTIGNSGTTPGTNFLGTIDEKDFIIKTFGAERMKFDKDGGLSAHTLSITSLAETFDGVNINTDSVTSGNGLKINVNSLTKGNGLNIYSNSTAGLTDDFSSMLRIRKQGANANPDHISCGILATISNSGADTDPFNNFYTSNYGGSFLVSGAHFGVGLDSYVLGVQDSLQQKLVGNTVWVDANNNTNVATWSTGLEVKCTGNRQGLAHGLYMLVGGSKVMEGIQLSLYNDTLAVGGSSHGISCGISGYAPKNSGEHAAGLFTNGITSTAATSTDWKYAIRATSTGAFSGTCVGGFFSAYGAPEGRNFAIIVPQESASSQWGGWVGIGTIKPERLLHVNGIVRVGGIIKRGRIELMAGSGYTSLNAGNNYLGQDINLLLPTTIGNAGEFLQVTPITADSAVLSWASPTTTSGWTLTGNSGTDPATNFLGTADLKDLVIKTNNAERMRIRSGGNVGIGTNLPNSLLHVAGVAQVGTANAQEGKLSFYNTGGSNAITLKAPTGASATEYTLPSADGTNGQVLQTNAAGVLNWASAGGGGGWHGSTTRIKLLPSDFASDDGDDNAIIANNGSYVAPSSTTTQPVATIAIPTGYTATKVMVYANTNLAITVYENDISNMTTAVNLGTGNCNTEIDITDLISSSTNYISISVTAGATSNRIYGGYITIQ